MILAEHVGILVNVVRQRVGSCFLVIDLLVHHAEIEVDVGNLWVVFAARQLQNAQSAPHVLESCREVACAMVVHSELRVVEADQRVFKSEDSLKDDDGLGLEFNRLEDVLGLKVDSSHLNDALGDVNLHGTTNLHGYVYRLRDKLQCSIKLVFEKGLIAIDEELSGIDAGISHVFENWEHFADHPHLERQVLVALQQFSLSQLRSKFLLLGLLGLHFRLAGLLDLRV